jgi:hypothetical protein
MARFTELVNRRRSKTRHVPTVDEDQLWPRGDSESRFLMDIQTYPSNAS